jgi:hypothetical protein
LTELNDATHRFAGEDAEPGFDQVEPRGSGGREVEMHLGVLRQPVTQRLLHHRVDIRRP